jgi:hypothetical protein
LYETVVAGILQFIQTVNFKTWHLPLVCRQNAQSLAKRGVGIDERS